MSKNGESAAVPEGQLGDWLDEIPEEVADAAEAYDRAHVAAGKAKAKLNSAKDRVIETMKETGTKRVPIRNGQKFLSLHELDQVKIEKPKKEEAGE